MRSCRTTHGREERAGKPHWVYALTDPDSGVFRYIGLSRNPVARRQDHMKDGCSGRLREWMCQLRSSEQEPGLVLLSYGETYDAVAWKEDAWIATASIAFGNSLLNWHKRADSNTWNQLKQSGRAAKRKKV